MSHPGRLVSPTAHPATQDAFHSRKPETEQAPIAKPVEGWGHDFTAESVQGFSLSFSGFVGKSVKAYIR